MYRSVTTSDECPASRWIADTGAPTNSELTTEGGYILAEDAWWVRTGHPTYAAAKFYAITAVTDPFGHVYTTAYDDHTLLTVSASAVMGKLGDSDGDTLEDPTSTFEHDLFAWQTTGKPNWAKSRVRETHQDPSTRWLEQRSYFSGGGAPASRRSATRTAY
jgi:YD repeat-containing protein